MQPVYKARRGQRRQSRAGVGQGRPLLGPVRWWRGEESWCHQASLPPGCRRVDPPDSVPPWCVTNRTQSAVTIVSPYQASVSTNTFTNLTLYLVSQATRGHYSSLILHVVSRRTQQSECHSSNQFGTLYLLSVWNSSAILIITDFIRASTKRSCARDAITPKRNDLQQ